MSLKEQKHGEFKGWRYWDEEPFENHTVGPFYFRVDEKGPVSAFRLEQRHLNAGGIAHGGTLLGFADYSLAGIAYELLQGERCLTVAFSSEFIKGGMAGDLVESRGEIIGGGKSMIFVRGLLTASGQTLMSFSATLKRLNKQ